MAADHDLKRLDGDLEAELESLFPAHEPTDEELEAYRGRLGEALERGPSRGRSRRRVGVALAAAAALTVAAIRLQMTTSGTFDQRSLEEVQAFIAESEDRILLSERAARALEGDDPLVRRNARLVRVMTGPADVGIGRAGEGVLDEPRADVRAFYLEWLLDRADEQMVDADRLEALIDDEEDPLCRDLLRQMLRIAERRSDRSRRPTSHGMTG